MLSLFLLFSVCMLGNGSCSEQSGQASMIKKIKNASENLLTKIPCSGPAMKKEIHEMKMVINQLKTKIESSKIPCSGPAMKKEMHEMKVVINQLKTEIELLKIPFNQLKTEIESLKILFNQLKTEIESLKISFNQLKTKIESLKQDKKNSRDQAVNYLEVPPIVQEDPCSSVQALEDKFCNAQRRSAETLEEQHTHNSRFDYEIENIKRVIENMESNFETLKIFTQHKIKNIDEQNDSLLETSGNRGLEILDLKDKITLDYSYVKKLCLENQQEIRTLHNEEIRMLHNEICELKAGMQALTKFKDTVIRDVQAIQEAQETLEFGVAPLESVMDRVSGCQKALHVLEELEGKINHHEEMINHLLQQIGY